MINDDVLSYGFICCRPDFWKNPQYVLMLRILLSGLIEESTRILCRIEGCKIGVAHKTPRPRAESARMRPVFDIWRKLLTKNWEIKDGTPPKFIGWNLKMMGKPRPESPNFQGLIFRFYVKLRGSIELRNSWGTKNFCKSNRHLFQTTARD